MKEIEDYFGLTSDASAWSFPFYKSNSYIPTGPSDTVEEIEKLLKRIETIEKSIGRIKQSDVYKGLRKLKNEHSPILYTNIFLYDRNYKAALELWKNLDRAKFDIQKDVAEKAINDEQATNDYGLFVFLCLMYAFIDLNYAADSISGSIFHDEKYSFVK